MFVHPINSVVLVDVVDVAASKDRVVVEVVGSKIVLTIVVVDWSVFVGTAVVLKTVVLPCGVVAKFVFVLETVGAGVNGATEVVAGVNGVGAGNVPIL